jgi:serine/threonine protein kinase
MKAKAKAKAITIVIAIAGIMLGMKFLHNFRFIHGDQRSSSVLFGEHYRIQIADF